uniref:Fc fragment of IgG binding protein n=1 Tax=Pelodiscus sinensis TaxID=13735 RepID=K7FKI2_PELSI
CPENSQYNACGSACPATCNDRVAPKNCSLPCVETCQCHEGFVLDAERCILQTGCGCEFEGRLYAPGEQFWGDGACTRRCVCDPQTRRASCQVAGCRAGEQCQVQNGIRDCYPTSYGTCSASGDPHYISFDGKKFDFQGTCLYQFAGLCNKSQDLVDFQVLVQNDHRGSRVVSFTKVVQVKIYEVDIVISRENPGRVLVNGVLTNLPYSHKSSKISMYRRGQEAVIQSDFGLTVTFDWQSRITVSAPSSYAGALCGLCGNLNGDKGDDLTMKGGRLAPNPTAFGQSWKVADIPGCVEVAKDECSDLAAVERRQRGVSQECGLLLDKSGPFRECHSKVDPQGYFQDCVYDYCFFQGRQAVTCQLLTSYAAACQAAGAAVSAWRNSSFCSVSCAPNSHYEVCARGCQSTCSSLLAPVQCSAQCWEGCVCDEGFVLSGDECVPMSQCGCLHQGRYYKAGETFHPTCQEQCVCRAGGDVVCTGLSCRPNEECKLANGVRKCRPVGSATCTAAGDPHYLSFDGVAFDFQGTCTYILAKTCADTGNLTSFAVKVENVPWGNGRVSVTKLVSVEVYGLTLTLLQNRKGLVMINDMSSSVPVTLEDGKIKLYQSGLSAVLQTDFGLQVSYDWNWHLIITLPSSYYGATCGLCGNFNQNHGDEMMSPTGTRVSSIVEWARSWKVTDRDPFCWDDCKGKCPACEEGKQEIYGGDEYCGLISKAPGGPFRECHPRVSPEDIFDSCVYDVCLNGGARIILCQALGAYAAICKKQGLTVYDWRTPSGCALPCPDNSHYEACGDACPASCSDRTANASCPEPCVETCQCNAGYVLSAGQCVPVGSCGCDYNGHYYQPSEEFWADENCRSRCRCDPSLGMVLCQETSCKASERCAVVNGVRGCQPISYSTCTASGDPHYTTFDGKKYDFMGTCIYQLARVCSQDPTLTPFSIKVENNNRGSKTVSFTKAVTLEVYGRNITLSQQHPRKIKVDGVFVDLPFYHEEKLQAYVSGAHVLIKTAFDLRVTFDWNSLVRVTVPSTYANALCGLCGDNNQTASDDLTMRDGRRAANAVQFAESWKVEESPGCSDICTGNCPLCSEAETQPYKGPRFCGLLTTGDGPFRECHRVINPAPFFDDCVLDTCQYKGHRDALCSAISTYVTACQARGIPLGPWRSASFCSPTCPRNSHYELCGNGCPATCHSLSAPDSCNAPCAEGCFCDAGFLLSGDQCVPIARCGCVHHGRYYRRGEEFYPSASCQERCRCQDNGAVECQEASCRASEQCRVENGVLGCHANGCGKCIASGDPHYLTFDGRAFDFQGTCTYSLARVCSSDTGLANFSVVVENESQVSVTRTVSVSVHGYTVTMERGRKWKVTVDGEFYTLPLATDDGKLWINQEGNNIIVQSASGPKVLYDTSYYVLVSVPSSYQGHVCGLCGNFNGDKNDDFLLPSGKSAQNADEFGAAWKVPVEGVTCSHGCGDRCPICDAAKMVPYQAESSCGLIKAPAGPFKDCHSLVSPAEYFSHCLYDMCAANGAREILCQSLQAYVAACQAAGGTVRAWRTASFCPFTCPANSHYELCTRSCDFTCAGLFSPAQCTAKCFEGCQCNAGYAFNGETC